MPGAFRSRHAKHKNVFLSAAAEHAAQKDIHSVDAASLKYSFHSLCATRLAAGKERVLRLER
jgi:hypothetical protein